MKSSLPLLFLAMLSVAQGAVTSPDWPIIHRKGDRLFEGDQPFRTLSLATPNIQQNENQLRPDFSNRFPDEYELRDLLGGLQRLGGRATRAFALSIADPADNGVPVYISARRTYNEEAFQCLDRLLALAREYDVRVILPFIASQSFPTIRGADEFAKLSGKPGAAFWTDPEVKADFKHFLHFLLNRRNTVSGVLYKDDPAILAWQLGNEFGSYPYDRKLDPVPYEKIILEWSLEMAAYIKEQDPKHLVMEAGGCDREALILSPHIDVISEHLYEYWNRLAGRPTDLGKLAAGIWKQCEGRRPLMIDEFGLGTTENQRELMRVIREDTGIAVGLMWSLRSHRRDGGWYYHNEGGTPVNSFHMPGFSVGFTYEETRLLDLLRKEAYALRGLPVPAVTAPSPAPVLLRCGGGFTWRGSTGASSYVLERAPAKTGPWTVIARDLEDSVIADAKTFEASPESSFPLCLHVDETADTRQTWFYRLKGVNVSGETPYSEVLEIQAKATHTSSHVSP